MSSEVYFRAALGMVILLTTLVTGFHRFKAAQSGEKLFRKEEGYLFAVLLRLVGLLLFVVTTTVDCWQANGTTASRGRGEQPKFPGLDAQAICLPDYSDDTHSRRC